METLISTLSDYLLQFLVGAAVGLCLLLWDSRRG